METHTCSRIKSASNVQMDQFMRFSVRAIKRGNRIQERTVDSWTHDFYCANNDDDDDDIVK